MIMMIMVIMIKKHNNYIMIMMIRRRKPHYWKLPFLITAISQYDTLNSLRPRQNGRHFADDTFKRIFVNENVRISMKISLKFVPKGPINNNPALVQIMAWRRSGDKPLSEPMMVSLLTHICVIRPQWVNQRKAIIMVGEYESLIFASVDWPSLVFIIACRLDGT